MTVKTFGSDATIASVLAWKRLPAALGQALRSSRASRALAFLGCVRSREGRFLPLRVALLAHDVGLVFGEHAEGIVGHSGELSQLTGVIVPSLARGEHLGLARRGDVIAAVFVDAEASFLWISRRGRRAVQRDLKGSIGSPVVRRLRKQP